MQYHWLSIHDFISEDQPYILWIFDLEIAYNISIINKYFLASSFNGRGKILIVTKMVVLGFMIRLLIYSILWEKLLFRKSKLKINYFLFSIDIQE